MKIRPVGAELFHANRQTDRHDEADNRFSQFCERAQKTEKLPNDLSDITICLAKL
jgi:hypothetical protein